MTPGLLNVPLPAICSALAALLVSAVAVHLLVIRRRLARATYLTVVRVIQQDLAQDELDGAVSPDAPAVGWLHGQLTLQQGNPGRLLDRREVCDVTNGPRTALLVRGYVAELLEARHDYLAACGSLGRGRIPRPRHVLDPRFAVAREFEQEPVPQDGDPTGEGPARPAAPADDDLPPAWVNPQRTDADQAPPWPLRGQEHRAYVDLERARPAHADVDLTSSDAVPGSYRDGYRDACPDVFAPGHEGGADGASNVRELGQRRSGR